ncbi:MAG: methylated-DNA--[protein]-cysteine S-methyltransferase [Ferruginibacter sp.]
MEESIHYNSPLGLLQIKCNGTGITEVSFVNKNGKQLIKEDEIVFEEPSSPVLKNCVCQLDDYFSGKLFDFDIELAQAGTAFQHQVWNELKAIPYGRTESYLLLSKKIGNIKAIRAVGTANGKNNIAIIVPCHRVIGSNGDLVGYGGDLWRKKWLLDHEGKFANGVQMLF